jgi:hypothetical protein
MEQIIYRPYGSYRFLAWVFICIALILCLLSYYFILPALLLLIPAFFLFRAGKVMIIADKSGIQLLNEKTSSHRYLPWDQLKCYQLTNLLNIACGENNLHAQLASDHCKGKRKHRKCQNIRYETDLGIFTGQLFKSQAHRINKKIQSRWDAATSMGSIATKRGFAPDMCETSF